MTLIDLAYRGDYHGVERLLDEGVDVNTQDVYGAELKASPLHVASGNGHKEVVELLLRWGAKVDIQNDFGDTPLIAATRGGHKEIIELLLRWGANVNMKNKSMYNEGSAALSIALTQGRKYREIAKVLVKWGAE